MAALVRLKLVNRPELARAVGVDRRPDGQFALGIAHGQRHVAENQGQRRDGPAVGKGADHFAMGDLALLVQLPADQPAVVRARVERVAFAVHRHRANVRR